MTKDGPLHKIPRRDHTPSSLGTLGVDAIWLQNTTPFSYMERGFHRMMAKVMAKTNEITVVDEKLPLEWTILLVIMGLFLLINVYFFFTSGVKW